MPRRVLHPHAQCYFLFLQTRELPPNSRPACRLIGTYRSIPSCNRFAFLRLVRLLTVLIIAASAMYQTKSLVTSESIERSACMNIALTVVALSAFTWVLSIVP